MPKNRRAIAFDFDGTLIQNGPLNLDKGVHIVFASWRACRQTGFSPFVAGTAAMLVDKMVAAYIRYPGAPRFEQFSAIVNVLVNGTAKSVDAFEGLRLDESYRAEYRNAREIYNATYSALNDAAAGHFWRPYPSVKKFLEKASGHFDLHIASGVTQDILERDLRRHGFDSRCFVDIQGGNEAGGNDKGTILAALRSGGDCEVLFVADSNRDLEYARQAGVKFFRIRSDEDFRRLAAFLPGVFPDERTSWDFEPFELDFLRLQSKNLVQRFADADDLPFVEMSRLINTWQADGNRSGSCSRSARATLS